MKMRVLYLCALAAFFTAGCTPQNNGEVTTGTRLTTVLTGSTTKTVSAMPVQVVDRLLPAQDFSRDRGGAAVTHIVIHFMSNVVNNPQDPYLMQDIDNNFRTYGVSSHYVISRDGTAYRFIPEERAAYHAGKGSLAEFPQLTNKLNESSIGIEMLAIGSKEDMSQYLSDADYENLNPQDIGYTEAQYQTLQALINELLQRYPSIKPDRKHIIGHQEYAKTKNDPGNLFDWSKIGFP